MCLGGIRSQPLSDKGGWLFMIYLLDKAQKIGSPPRQNITYDDTTKYYLVTSVKTLTGFFYAKNAKCEIITSNKVRSCIWSSRIDSS